MSETLPEVSNNEALRSERDALCVIGVLAHAYLSWDPPIAAGADAGGKLDFTHFAGLNIHALIVDNEDGEVLALERNLIHEFEDPTRHAEQAAIHSAMNIRRLKHPRPAGMSVEGYYRSHLFYQPGSADEDFVRKGCTLYTTLEPCPYCTAAICVCRMKRTVYAVPDKKFGGSWGTPEKPGIKQFYNSYDLRYEPFAAAGASAAATAAGKLFAVLTAQVDDLRKAGLQDTWFLDRLHDLLAQALDLLTSLKLSDITARGLDGKINAATLLDLKRLCRLPS